MAGFRLGFLILFDTRFRKEAESSLMRRHSDDCAKLSVGKVRRLNIHYVHPVCPVARDTGRAHHVTVLHFN